MSKKIFIIAGEASSDRLAAELVREIKTLDPELVFTGYGGRYMKDQGVEIIYDLVQLALIGFVEVIRHLPLFFRVMKKIKTLFASGDIDMVLLIDYPGLNLRVAKLAKKFNIPVVYFVSPQVWAWGKDRDKEISRCVDLMLVIFPFEEKIFREAGCPVTFVGHPLADKAHPSKDKSELLNEFSLDSSRPVIGLFPGSRKQEIRYHYPVILETVNKLLRINPGIQFVLGHGESLPGDIITPCKDVLVIRGRTYDIMEVSDFLIASSGTITTEAVLMTTPLIVVYRVSFLSYLLGKFLIRVPSVGMVNILAGKRIVPELIQNNLTPWNLTRHAKRFLNNPDKLDKIRDEMKIIKNTLASTGAIQRAANKINEFILNF